MNVGVKKGQVVWIINDRINKSPIKTVVKSVGPKYIITEHNDKLKFYNDEQKYEVDGCGIRRQLITDLEAHIEKQRIYVLTRKLERVDWSKYDTDLLEKIANLIELK